MLCLEGRERLDSHLECVQGQGRQVTGLSFFIYCLALAFKHYRQVYIVHSGLQDESLQVTISNLQEGSLTCTRGDFPCTGDIQLTFRSKGRCTYLVSSLHMTLEKAHSNYEIFIATSGDRTWDLYHQRQVSLHLSYHAWSPAHYTLE